MKEFRTTRAYYTNNFELNGAMPSEIFFLDLSIEKIYEYSRMKDVDFFYSNEAVFIFNGETIPDLIEVKHQDNLVVYCLTDVTRQCYYKSIKLDNGRFHGKLNKSFRMPSKELTREIILEEFDRARNNTTKRVKVL